MDVAEALTRWTIRLAVVLYVLGLSLRWYGKRGVGQRQLGRIVWTIGCVACLAHIAVAFAYYHHWGHGAAYEHTARRSAELTGIAWGGGLYFNYLFALVWVADVGAWWRGLERYEARSRLVEYSVQIFFAFMFFNATVIFARGMVRWLGWLALVAFLFVFWDYCRHVTKSKSARS